jgi:excisionase family DNA binding protein
MNGCEINSTERGRSEMTTSASINRRLYQPEQAAMELGLSRTKVWDLIRKGELASTKVGKRRLIFADSLELYVERLKSAS